jgi:hypothetical protein
MIKSNSSLSPFSKRQLALGQMLLITKVVAPFKNHFFISFQQKQKLISIFLKILHSFLSKTALAKLFSVIINAPAE